MYSVATKWHNILYRCLIDMIILALERRLQGLQSLFHEGFSNLTAFNTQILFEDDAYVIGIFLLKFF